MTDTTDRRHTQDRRHTHPPLSSGAGYNPPPEGEGTFAQGRPVHGGLNVAELESLGLSPEEVIDFSASINPLGPSLRALEAARSLNLAAYPDPDCLKLREAIGEALGVEPGRILPGNGSTELIHLLARAYLSPPAPNKAKTALIFAPTFGEYDAACRIQGVTPVTLFPPNLEIAGRPFHWDLPGALDSIATLRPAVVFLCNPNNPTGVYLGHDEVAMIAGALQGIGLLVLDEAYVSFVEESWDSTPLLRSTTSNGGNVALLRSMTKDYALTGLRLGYMLASEEIVGRVRSFQYSWSVTSPAQAAGIAAIADREQVEKGREAVREGKKYLLNTARSLGLECGPSAANFLLLKVGRASELRRQLLTQHKVCVRDCASFSLPEYIRVGVRTMDDNRRLADALRQVLSDLHPHPNLPP